jgi:uncharacterized protein YecT (DUF1311 family)
VLKEQDQSGGLNNASVRSLLDTHLVRSEQRAGATWYELAHDRLVAPVRASNQQWFDAKLHSFQKIAAVWEAQRGPDGLLLVGAAFEEAKHWAEANGAFVTNSEQSFLEKSREKQRAVEREREAEQAKAEAQARHARRMRWAASFSGALAVVAVVFGVTACQQKEYAQELLAALRPSWCSEELNTAELTVCDTPTLRFLDAELTQRYQAAINHRGLAPEKGGVLRSDEKMWVGMRNACGSDKMGVASY